MAGDTPGPELTLTEELSLKIRSHVLDGMKYIDIQSLLGISPSTWDYWVWKNAGDFRVSLNQWKAERLLRKSEKISEEILDLEHEKEGKVISDLLKIKQKEAEFLRETLGKVEYSKRSEVTGADGQSLIPGDEVREKVDKVLDEFLSKRNSD